MEKKKSREWLLLNAVLCYLHYFPENQFTEQYQELANEFRNPPTVRKRGRKAQRQRTKETTSNTTSKETT